MKLWQTLNPLARITYLCTFIGFTLLIVCTLEEVSGYSLIPHAFLASEIILLLTVILAVFAREWIALPIIFCGSFLIIAFTLIAVGAAHQGETIVNNVWLLK